MSESSPSVKLLAHVRGVQGDRRFKRGFQVRHGIMSGPGYPRREGFDQLRGFTFDTQADINAEPHDVAYRAARQMTDRAMRRTCRAWGRSHLAHRSAPLRLQQWPREAAPRTRNPRLSGADGPGVRGEGMAVVGDRLISRHLRILEASALISGVILSSCVTDRVENVRLSPPSSMADERAAVVSDGDVQRALEIVDEVAREFEFRRLEMNPRGQKVQDDVTRGMGFLTLVEYARDRAPGAFVLLQVSTALDRSDFVVTVSTLRGGSAAAGRFLVEVRDTVASRLQEAFPEWKIETISGTVDATLAP
jgi:hypothetical protein